MKKLPPKVNAQAVDGYPLIAGPVWENGCEHEDEAYVCSFEVMDWHQKDTRKFDMYVFAENSKRPGQSVCIRYGHEPERYISPGDLGSFLARSGFHNHDEYHWAAKILTELGGVTWKPKHL